MDFDPIVIKNDKPALMTVVDEGLGPETLPHPRTTKKANFSKRQTWR